MFQRFGMMMGLVIGAVAFAGLIPIKAITHSDADQTPTVSADSAS